MQLDAMFATQRLVDDGYIVITSVVTGHDPRPTVQISYTPELQELVREGKARIATLRGGVKQIEWDMDDVLVIAIEPKEAGDAVCH
jgi:hypothetical protein